MEKLKPIVLVNFILLTALLIVVFTPTSCFKKQTLKYSKTLENKEVGIISFLIRPGCKIIWKTINENQIDSTTLKVKINYEIYCPNEHDGRSK